MKLPIGNFLIAEASLGDDIKPILNRFKNENQTLLETILFQSSPNLFSAWMPNRSSRAECRSEVDFFVS
jgi:hypothetical protein